MSKRLTVGSNTHGRHLAAALLVAMSLGLAACSSPEDKVAAFYKKGQTYLDVGDFVKARLEFQNALQINPNSVPAMYGMVTIAERASDWPRAYGLLTKVVELDPKHLEAQIKLGKLLLAGAQLDKALATSDAALALQPDSPDTLALRAAVMFKLDDRKAAVDLAQKALERNPKHIDALVVLASERLAADDAAGAVAFLDRALADNERDVALQLIKVQALEKMAKLDGAEAIFKKLIEFYPDNKVFRHILAQFYLIHNKRDLAEAQYRAVVADNPKDLEAKLDVVRFLGGTQGPEAAAGELLALIKADPKAHDLKLTLAAIRVQQNKRDEAQALWRAVMADAGDDAAGLRARGALATDLLGRGNKEEAGKLIADILAKDARNEQGLLLRAGVAMDDRRLDDAVGDLRTILRDVPTSARAHVLLARAHEMQGAKDLAQDHFARAAQAGKFAPAFGMAYADFLMRTGKARQVEDVLRETLRASPRHVPAYRLLAQAYLTTGNLVAAQNVADQVAKMGDQAVAANQIQGAVAAARNQFENSISSFKKAYELSPTEVQPMVALVRTYLRAGKVKEAQSFMQSVVAASPDNVSARVLQAQLALQTGSRDAARQGFEAALQRDPKNAAAYLGMVNVLVAEKKLDAADQVLERALKEMPGDFGMRLARAGLMEQANKLDDAIALYEQLLKERPNADVVANNLASLLADFRTDEASHKRAHELAQRLRDSNIPQFKDTVGWTNHRVGKFNDAASLLKDAATEIPDLPVVHYHHGMNLLAQNNKDAARQSLQRALDIASKGVPFAQQEEARKALQGL
jgi:cellulose synthase operon protein C